MFSHDLDISFQLKQAHNGFQLMGQYYKLLPVTTTIRTSNKRPIITKQVVANNS